MVRANHPTEAQSDATYMRRFCFGFSFGKNYGFGSILGLMYMGMTLAVSLADYANAAGAFPTGYEVLENSLYLKRIVSSLWFYPPFLWLAVQNVIIAVTSQAMNVRRNLRTALALSTVHTLAHLALVFALRKVSDAAWAQAMYSASGDRNVDFANDVLFTFLSNSSMFFLGYFLGELDWFYALKGKIEGGRGRRTDEGRNVTTTTTTTRANTRRDLRDYGVSLRRGVRASHLLQRADVDDRDAGLEGVPEASLRAADRGRGALLDRGGEDAASVEGGEGGEGIRG